MEESPMGTRRIMSRNDDEKLLVRSWRGNNSQEVLQRCSLKRKRYYLDINSLTGFDVEVTTTATKTEDRMRWHWEEISNKKGNFRGFALENSTNLLHLRKVPVKGIVDHHQQVLLFLNDKGSLQNEQQQHIIQNYNIITNGNRGKKMKFQLIYDWMTKILWLTVLIQAFTTSTVHATELPRTRMLQSLGNTTAPSIKASATPSLNLSQRPSLRPSLRPTKNPTKLPSHQPSAKPTSMPSHFPSMKASSHPTLQPTFIPSSKPSSKPTMRPSTKPSVRPTSLPSMKPSLRPSTNPSSKPSFNPSSQPTVLHSSQPSSTQKPSNRPSYKPTSFPTTHPSFDPSDHPSPMPSISGVPSFSPTFSAKPSNTPSQKPSLTGSSMPSQQPSPSPSTQPSSSQMPSAQPSDRPSSKPSVSPSPSEVPSSLPTTSPSTSPSNQPTLALSYTPTISSQPSSFPSISTHPSSSPSNQPSQEPTNFAESQAKGTFYQEFNTSSTINSTQSDSFERLIEGYTQNFSTAAATTIRNNRISTTCKIEVKTFIGRQQKLGLRYVVQYESIHTNVTNYELFLEMYINRNLTKMEKDLMDIGIDVFEARSVFLLELTEVPTSNPSTAPSVIPTTLPSLPPSTSPTSRPTYQPSVIPSSFPTSNPSHSPSITPTLYQSPNPSSQPSHIPSANPTTVPTISPTSNPTFSPTAKITPPSTIIATVSAAIGGMAIIVAAGMCMRRKCYKSNNDDNDRMIIVDGTIDPEGQRRTNTNGILGGGLLIRSPRRRRRNNNDRNQHQQQQLNPSNTIEPPPSSFQIDHQRLDNLGVPIAPSINSMISHESIISTGSSVDDGESENDFDDRQILDDEFEKYKDQNLEKMRSKLEGIVTNFDGMMCQALTMALMEEDDDNMSEAESLMVGEKDSIQIEVDLLCEINDWLKRTELASVDERREFMQESLNKMVANVRHGVISHEDATRAIHGSAALLGLQLAADIPETTLIVTGMRKSVATQDVVEAFKKFGEIESAAVSSNRRGFGIVRFTSKKYAKRALERQKNDEIVVQDVAVSVRLLTAKMPEIEVNRVYSNERRNR